jgi:transcriptional regulator with XRE-family HTH domain
LRREAVAVTRVIKPIERHVGGRVRLRRTLLGMSQGNLGKALGVTFQQVQKYEKGQNRIGASRLQQIGRLLEVPVSYFFEGAPADSELATTGLADSGDTAYVADFVSTKEGQQLIRAFVRIDDITVRKKILDLVEAMSPESTPDKARKKKPSND